MASGTTFFSAHGDKLFLVVSLLALAGTAATAVLGGGSDGGVPPPATRGKSFASAGIDALRKEFDSLDKTYAPAQTNQLALISEIRVGCTNATCKTLLPWTAEVCFKCQAKQPKRGVKTDSDGDGLPDVVEIANGLDPSKNDVNQDLDKDGFANGEEIRLGSKPNDPASHPPLIGKLRVDQIGDRPLKFHLKEITKAGTAILLQVSIAGTDKLNAKVGETVNGWLVKSYNDTTKTLDISKDGETLKLPRGKPVEKNRRVASLKSLADPSFKTVTVLPGERVKVDGTDYVVQEITESTVVLRAAAPDSPRIVVPKTSEQDLQAQKAMQEPVADASR